MPQFDKVTFFGQLFWFSFIFSSLFFYVSHKYVPILSLYTKIKHKVLKYNAQNYNDGLLIKDLENKVSTFYKEIISTRTQINTELYQGRPMTSEILWSNFDKEYTEIFETYINLNIKNNISRELLD